jgi:hypothetical protein
MLGLPSQWDLVKIGESGSNTAFTSDNNTPFFPFSYLRFCCIMTSKSKRKATKMCHIYAGEDRTSGISLTTTTILNATRRTKRARVISTALEVVGAPEPDGLPSIQNTSSSLDEDFVNTPSEEEIAEIKGSLERKKVCSVILLMLLSSLLTRLVLVHNRQPMLR